MVMFTSPLKSPSRSVALTRVRSRVGIVQGTVLMPQRGPLCPWLEVAMRWHGGSGEGTSWVLCIGETWGWEGLDISPSFLVCSSPRLPSCRASWASAVLGHCPHLVSRAPPSITPHTPATLGGELQTVAWVSWSWGRACVRGGVT